ncbi:TPA: hypothetical protein KDY52_003106 [Vibrio parahaemolyticus]|uniref:ComF family protein n=5 Tax=Vibrionaceae TaxID=641 RepID=UPI0013C50148|nr:hypothetical protein [Vibrio parahaemolyticus]EHY0992457.1 hypothetical protein [Vibrio parahaemolyticus]EJK2180781.1 hypothetical protein [Vibrio parahaemolyticus]WMN85136.1 hypothetical protein NI384_22855 [Vibrio parahaemolyticus]HAS3079450.1 hypothetical protein [Vibrio parahaemolyticus]HAS3084216.1 hypothetical protein [Vibrio parahaemolyticus]
MQLDAGFFMEFDFMTVKTYQQGVVYSVVDYHPYRKFGEHNPARNGDTYKIMDLKNPEESNHGKAVVYFGELFNGGIQRLLAYLNTNTIQVAIVPSSKVGKKSIGLEGVLAHVKQANLLYNPNFLKRVESIPAAHEGGERSLQNHLNTIKVSCNPDPNIPLLLLDDVTTTGTSLEACRQLLVAAGVKQVYMVALGRTV